MTEQAMNYLPWIPRTVPPGQVLVHNHIRPARRQATRGFRYWLQPLDEHVEPCECGWAPELPEHYRVKREGCASS
jgi:hypothetical protein